MYFPTLEFRDGRNVWKDGSEEEIWLAANIITKIGVALDEIPPDWDVEIKVYKSEDTSGYEDPEETL